MNANIYHLYYIVNNFFGFERLIIIIVVYMCVYIYIYNKTMVVYLIVNQLDLINQ